MDNNKNFENEPNPLHLQPDLDARLEVLPQNLVDGGPRSIYEQTLKAIYRTYGQGEFIGANTKAIEAVQDGLLNSLEEVALLGKKHDSPRHIIFPIHDYFEHPDKKIVDTMRHRTDYLNELFMLDELQVAIDKSNGRHISADFPVEHPEYSWAKVKADNHTTHGINFEFFKQKPEQDDAIGETDYRIGLSFKGSKDFPGAVSEDYPYFAGMSITRTSGQGENYSEETKLELTDEEEKLLGSATRTLITEVLAAQFSSDLEIGERNRAFISNLAKGALKDVEDPVEAREKLEKLGIDDDPENYR